MESLFRISILGYVLKSYPDYQKISLHILSYPFVSLHILSYPIISSGANSQMHGLAVMQFCPEAQSLARRLTALNATDGPVAIRGE